ncbi:MAG TPA: hypothetical protein VLA71_08965 [Algoriphagus sp.]|nr:hypothetical protein [Algoriphagus sp.]
MNYETKKSILTYFSFLLVCIVGIFWAKYLVDPYPFLRVWNWISVMVLLIGIPFVFLQKQAGIPEFWSKEISNRNRIWFPALIGIVFGILDVWIIKGILHPEPYSELPPFLQPFPYSIFLYFSGAFEVEVFYRLIPIVLVLFIFSKIKKGKYFSHAFWVIAVLTAIREPLEQMPSGETWFIVYALISGFSMNFIQALYFKKSGFIANLSLRLGHYLVWHILLGVYVELVELV